MIVIAVVSFAVQWRFKSKFKKYTEMPLSSGYSGKDIAELNQFLKQFEQMKGMMKMMNKMPMGNMPGMGRR